VRWEKARKTYLASHPLCAMCQREGRVTAATVVDHIKPHKGDTKLFWDVANNWQALCKPHHDQDKQREERGRFQSIGEDGWPIQ
jgi:5-methylcytosine-specific restriction endonuclease McrA